MNDRQAYDELIQRFREAKVLGSCAAVLAWDEQTYMPPGGTAHRGNQLALLAGMQHQRLTDPQIGKLLDIAEASSLAKDPLSAEAVNIREIRRDYDRATKLPQSLVEELARVTSRGQHEWAEARKKNRFADFLPWLEKILHLKQQEAQALRGDKKHLYDALMDAYEPDASTEEIASLFANLRAELVPLVSAICNATKQPNLGILNRDYPVDRQQMFGELAAASFGFDFKRGRLDRTTHPFCTGLGPGDVRITTRYNPKFFNESFFGILHEAGHGMYEQGLPAEHYGTPMGEAVSLGIHESQSRLWENEVGRGRAFWRHFFPLAQRVFREALGTEKLDDFYFAINSVQPSFIRVEADEVTYNLHILIRFELEQALIAGDLSAGDVPGAWNEKYTKYLGITPTTDAEGCLQDIHWSAGLIGYFPTYSLGNLFGAQLFVTAEKELGDLEDQFAAGRFEALHGWLTEKVYRHARRYPSAELVKEATGQAPSHKPLMDLMRSKFGEVYGL